jgi:hypothetical protein
MPVLVSECLSNISLSALVSAKLLLDIGKTESIDIIFIYLENKVSKATLDAMETLDKSTRLREIKKGKQLRRKSMTG